MVQLPRKLYLLVSSRFNILKLHVRHYFLYFALCFRFLSIPVSRLVIKMYSAYTACATVNVFVWFFTHPIEFAGQIIACCFSCSSLKSTGDFWMYFFFDDELLILINKISYANQHCRSGNINVTDISQKVNVWHKMRFLPNWSRAHIPPQSQTVKVTCNNTDYTARDFNDLMIVNVLRIPPQSHC